MPFVQFCHKCLEQGIEGSFPDFEDTLDGTHIHYCTKGLHEKILPTEKLVRRTYIDYFQRERTYYRTLKSEKDCVIYHEHSGYGKHPITRKHRKTEKKHRRFNNIEEWRAQKEAKRI